MTVAVFTSIHSGTSLLPHLQAIISFLTKHGIQCEIFDEASSMPLDADVYWDAVCADAGIPFEGINKENSDWLLTHPNKLCITMHSATVFTIPPWVYLKSLGGIYWAIKTRWQRRRFWRSFDTFHSLITVSDYARYEITHFAGLPSRNIEVIHHGVDHNLFQPSEQGENCENPYLLHISSYQRVKNVDRLIKAYQQINNPNKPKLRLIVPNYTGKIDDANIELITTNQGHAQLVAQYQHATGFIFPSLVESFGLPILEAMACGCPVVTSNRAGCAEVAGDAALLVDPYNVKSIQSALEVLIDSKETRQSLSKKGIARADQFDWSKSGRQHLALFEKIAAGKT